MHPIILTADDAAILIMSVRAHRAHLEDHVHLDQPPALAFHVLDDERRLTTHYRCVND